jgi:hypothetical protein
MKIKILMSCAGPAFSFRAGKMVDIDVATAKDLIRASYAEEVPDGKGNSSAGKRTGKSG